LTLLLFGISTFYAAALHSLVRHSADASHGSQTQAAIVRRPRRQLDAVPHTQLPRGHPFLYLRAREKEPQSHRATEPQSHSSTGREGGRGTAGVAEAEAEAEGTSIGICMPPRDVAHRHRLQEDEEEDHRRIRLGSKLKPRDPSKSNLPAPVNFLAFGQPAAQPEPRPPAGRMSSPELIV
jgi:hypothetical protein